jgi:transposase
VKRRHLSKETWEAVIKAVEELEVPLKPLLQELGVSRSSYYRRRREYEEGGISPRRRGSGRQRRYTVEAWGKRIVEVLRALPPMVGHRRVWVKLKGEGLSRSTVWRLMREMGLVLPREKGKAKRRYEVLRAELPGSGVDSGYHLLALEWDWCLDLPGHGCEESMVFWDPAVSFQERGFHSGFLPGCL